MISRAWSRLYAWSVEVLVRYSILAAASGSIGGVTASHGRSGQFVRARTVPTNPGSSFQSLVRTIFGNLSIAWQTLTFGQRDAWATYAENVPVRNRLGDTIRLTGHAMYIRNNAARMQDGLPRVDDAPTAFTLTTLSPITVVPDATAFKINLTVTTEDPWTAELGAQLLVWATRQSSGTVRFRKNPYRSIRGVAGPINPPFPATFTITPEFALDANGSNSIFVRCLAIQPDGRISPFQTLGPLLIVAP